MSPLHVVNANDISSVPAWGPSAEAAVERRAAAVATVGAATGADHPVATSMATAAALLTTSASLAEGPHAGTDEISLVGIIVEHHVCTVQ